MAYIYPGSNNRACVHLYVQYIYIVEERTKFPSRLRGNARAAAASRNPSKDYPWASGSKRAKIDARILIMILAPSASLVRCFPASLAPSAITYVRAVAARQQTQSVVRLNGEPSLAHSPTTTLTSILQLISAPCHSSGNFSVWRLLFV